jgi:hypothetical protein
MVFYFEVYNSGDLGKLGIDKITMERQFFGWRFSFLEKR